MRRPYRSSTHVLFTMLVHPVSSRLPSQSRPLQNHKSIVQSSTQRSATARAKWRSSTTVGRARRQMAARAQASSQSGAKAKTSVLFVCLGNICRSPTAEAMFRSVVEKACLGSQFDIDSCGTGGGSSNWYLPGGFSYHEGDESDPRMTAAAVKRGVRLTSTSRPLQPSDLNRFDYIIGMDPRNVRDILKAANYWAEQDQQLPQLDEVRSKTSLMTRYCSKAKAADEVPDPYYGGPAGFDLVLDLLDDAATGLLAHIQQEQQAAVKQ